MDKDIALRIVAATPLLGGVESVEQLSAGYSDDKKYVLWQNGEPRYLLRLSSSESATRRRTEFGILAALKDGGILCPTPHMFGITEDGSACYSVLGYIAGRSAQEALPELGERQQYELGSAAGKELRKLHAFRHPDQRADWATRRTEKYLRYLQDARDLGLTLDYQTAVEDYVRAHLRILQDSPVALQHDDYHVGNMIVRDGEFQGIIDFSNCDWGDPIEDLYKAPWMSAPISLPFVRGQIDGYLAGGPVRAFWPRYNLYVAMSFHSSLVWTHRRFPESIPLWRRKIKEIVETHNFEKNGPPLWYTHDLKLLDVNQ